MRLRRCKKGSTGSLAVIRSASGIRVWTASVTASSPHGFHALLVAVERAAHGSLGAPRRILGGSGARGEHESNQNQPAARHADHLCYLLAGSEMAASSQATG